MNNEKFSIKKRIKSFFCFPDNKTKGSCVVFL